MRHPHIHSNGLFYIIQAYQFNTLDTVFSLYLYTTSSTCDTPFLQSTQKLVILHVFNLHYSKSYTHFTETKPARYRAQKCSADLEFNALSHTEPPCFIKQTKNKNTAETALLFSICNITLKFDNATGNYFQNGPFDICRIFH